LTGWPDRKTEEFRGNAGSNRRRCQAGVAHW
jgi:hypothetical protein